MRQAALKCESKSADAKANENEAVRGPGKEKSREIELDSKGKTIFLKKGAGDRWRAEDMNLMFDRI